MFQQNSSSSQRWHPQTPQPAINWNAIEAYAQLILTDTATQTPDDSLGSYIVSVIRESTPFDAVDNAREQLPEYDNLLELIQEHCHVETMVATNALDAIVQAVGTGRVPGARTPRTPNTPLTISPATATNLIPQDLLDENDAFSAMGHIPQHQETPQLQPLTKTVVVSDEDFPSLASSSATKGPNASALKKPKSRRASRASAAPASAPVPCLDLAATLFRTRTPPPQQELLERAGGYHQYQRGSSHKTDAPPPHENDDDNAEAPDYESIQATTEMLLSMYPPDLLCHDAALAAASLSFDLPVAQYVIEAARTAPPVCRHLLSDGCYRADCAFSHDLEAHTCVFWLSGRCGKGSECKFLHGFARQVLNDMPRYNHHEWQNTNHLGTVPTINTRPPWSGSSTFPELDDETLRRYHEHAQRHASMSNLAVSVWHSPYATSTATATAAAAPPGSFANVASTGYDQNNAFANEAFPGLSSPTLSHTTRTVRIPQDLWSPNEQRDAGVFYITDPLERYHAVMAAQQHRPNVIDLHYQSTTTFGVVLHEVLPDLLLQHGSVWIVTGTGHHVTTGSHQKGGGLLEQAVMEWLQHEGYVFARGRDRNGQGGAVYVQS